MSELYDNIMKAADMVEQEGRYDFCEAHVPKSCKDTGCVLGWIGFFIGGCRTNGHVAEYLGYEGDTGGFYTEMNRLEDYGYWMVDASVAAKTLRKYAQLYHAPESAIPDSVRRIFNPETDHERTT